MPQAAANLSDSQSDFGMCDEIAVETTILQGTATLSS